MATKDPSFNELRTRGRLVGRLGDEDVYALDGRWYSIDEYAADGRTYHIVLPLDPWEYELVEREEGAGEGQVSWGTGFVV